MKSLPKNDPNLITFLQDATGLSEAEIQEHFNRGQEMYDALSKDELGIPQCPHHRYVTYDAHPQPLCANCGRQTTNPTILTLIANAKLAWKLAELLAAKANVTISEIIKEMRDDEIPT